MTKFIYIFTYIVFKGISLMPYSVIYVLSDLLYLFIHYLIGYRKSVVFSNLKLVFPQYSDVEHLRIAKAFYKHLCDKFFEMLKLMSVSKSEILKRFQILNPEVISILEAQDKSIIFLYAHYCTFKYSAAFTLYGLNFKPYGVYKK
ncbi:MAG: lipid A biosynthesis acyltransferase, partial [Psychroflexus sp.]|nr:lipid A biosynthesis acyltransferase [Psychroflexus sp.]